MTGNLKPPGQVRSTCRWFLHPIEIESRKVFCGFFSRIRRIGFNERMELPFISNGIWECAAAMGLVWTECRRYFSVGQEILPSRETAARRSVENECWPLFIFSEQSGLGPDRPWRPPYRGPCDLCCGACRSAGTHDKIHPVTDDLKAHQFQNDPVSGSYFSIVTAFQGCIEWSLAFGRVDKKCHEA